jgi:predicted amino acid dehydrogenase/ribosome-associated toxin RatA of RatAB toxin-antitoxin module
MSISIKNRVKVDNGLEELEIYASLPHPEKDTKTDQILVIVPPWYKHPEFPFEAITSYLLSRGLGVISFNFPMDRFPFKVGLTNLLNSIEERFGSNCIGLLSDPSAIDDIIDTIINDRRIRFLLTKDFFEDESLRRKTELGIIKRRHIRLASPTDINFEYNNRTYHGRAKDIGLGGLLVELLLPRDDPLFYDDMVLKGIRVSIDLRGLDETIEVRADVVWRKWKDAPFNKRKLQMGMSFIKLSEYEQNRLNLYLLQELHLTKEKKRLSFPANVEGSIIVKRDINFVYGLLKRPEEFPSFIGTIKNVNILREENGRKVSNWNICIDGINIFWQQEDIYNEEKKTISFKMLRGDFTRYEGEWHLLKLASGTKIHLSLNIDWGLGGFGREIEDVLRQTVQGYLESILNGLRKKMWKKGSLSRVEKFAFLIHPIEVRLTSLAFHEPNLRMKAMDFLRGLFERFPSFRCSYVTGIRSLTGKEIDGELLYFPLLPEQLLELDKGFILEKMIEAGRLAQNSGAKILGLGAYTALVGMKGAKIAKALSIPVTTGTNYTIAINVEGIERVAHEVGLRLGEATLTVVGATGSIGSICSKIFANRVKRLIMVARNKERLEGLAATIRGNASAEVEECLDIKGAISVSDIIITVTSSTQELIDVDLLPPGAIVCDLSRPRNVSEDGCNRRDDILVFDGGVVRPPGDVDFNFYFGLPPGLCYACMAETMILALEGRYESYSIGGNVSVEKVNEISMLGKRHGFSLAKIQSFERSVQREEIERVAMALRKRKGGSG